MRIVALALAMFISGGLVGHLCGCAPPEHQLVTETVENAAAVAQYKLLLADCRKKGREAGSYAVYAECADAVDADLCRVRSLRCTDGGAP